MKGSTSARGKGRGKTSTKQLPLPKTGLQGSEMLENETEVSTLDMESGTHTPSTSAGLEHPHQATPHPLAGSRQHPDEEGDYSTAEEELDLENVDDTIIDANARSNPRSVGRLDFDKVVVQSPGLREELATRNYADFRRNLLDIQKEMFRVPQGQWNRAQEEFHVRLADLETALYDEIKYEDELRSAGWSSRADNVREITRELRKQIVELQTMACGECAPATNTGLGTTSAVLFEQNSGASNVDSPAAETGQGTKVPQISRELGTPSSRGSSSRDDVQNRDKERGCDRQTQPPRQNRPGEGAGHNIVRHSSMGEQAARLEHIYSQGIYQAPHSSRSGRLYPRRDAHADGFHRQTGSNRGSHEGTFVGSRPDSRDCRNLPYGDQRPRWGLPDDRGYYGEDSEYCGYPHAPSWGHEYDENVTRNPGFNAPGRGGGPRPSKHQESLNRMGGWGSDPAYHIMKGMHSTGTCHFRGMCSQVAAILAMLTI